MNIYLVSRRDGHVDYDEYDSFVIICETEEVARHSSPDDTYKWNGEEWGYIAPNGLWRKGYSSSWIIPNEAIVELIGTSNATEKRIVCASFNAG